MAQLLLEIFCEEIPARMQARAEEDLTRLFTEQVKAAGLTWDSLQAFSGPRRLGLVIEGLPAKTEDVREERKGPRTDAPEKALQGFMRGAGIDSLEQCKIEEGKKGSFYIAVIEKPGRQTAEVIAQAIPDVIKAFPWPKSMKFGDGETAQRWVRPLRSIISLFDGQVVDTEVFGIRSGKTTDGHRVHGSGPFEVESFADYEAKLRQNGVILHRAERKQLVLEGARRVCEEAGLELIEDQGLLEEVTGLVEHPCPILGDMDPEFLDLPPEVIALTMKTHQKYFAVRDPKTGKLTHKFVVLANQDAPDGGKAIALGNARVLSARLSDARHFWDIDIKTGLEAMAPELSKVTFHEKLGTLADKVERVAKLARELAPVVGADADLAETAARLAKADLVSQMVYEFPELQGAMGRYYALEAGLDPQIADAIKDHYKPQGPSDAVPTAPVSAAVALADKLDTLVGFWAIDEKPTGSKDPFALRRAVLGDIRIKEHSDLRVSVLDAINCAARHLLEYVLTMENVYVVRFELTHEEQVRARYAAEKAVESQEGMGFSKEKARTRPCVLENPTLEGWQQQDSLLVVYDGKVESGFAHTIGFIEDGFHCLYRSPTEFSDDLLSFFADRLKVHLKDEGVKHDVIDAVFALGDDDLVRVTKKARALQAFIDTEDGKALLAGYTRAANILGKEEAKDDTRYDSDPDAEYLAGNLDPAERGLVDALDAAVKTAAEAVAKEDFEAGMAALAQLRGPVDAFFEAVVVNDKDDIVRRNRLRILSRLRAAADTMADFSRLEG